MREGVVGDILVSFAFTILSAFQVHYCQCLLISYLYSLIYGVRFQTASQ